MATPADLGPLVQPSKLEPYKKYYFWHYAGLPQGKYDRVTITNIKVEKFAQSQDQDYYRIKFISDTTNEKNETVFVVKHATGDYPKSLLLGRFYEIEPFGRRAALLATYDNILPTNEGGARRKRRSVKRGGRRTRAHRRRSYKS